MFIILQKGHSSDLPSSDSSLKITSVRLSWHQLRDITLIEYIYRLHPYFSLSRNTVYQEFIHNV